MITVEQIQQMTHNPFVPNSCDCASCKESRANGTMTTVLIELHPGLVKRLRDWVAGQLDALAAIESLGMPVPDDEVYIVATIQRLCDLAPPTVPIANPNLN